MILFLAQESFLQFIDFIVNLFFLFENIKTDIKHKEY